mgnify:CR=1 FL=1
MAGPPSARLPELVSFIENLDEPRILVDGEYRILAANRAYRQAYSPHHSVVGRYCYEVSHHYKLPCDEAGESCPRRQALKSGHTARVLHLHHTPRGEEHVRVELSPVKDAQGQIAYFVERIESLPTARAESAANGLVGRSAPFRKMLELVTRVAPSDASVLLLGETGAGKEMVARAIHAGSRRADAPFVAVDCSGLTETLFESELFGYEKGAFTGAAQRKIGLVEAAGGGTLFLDEVGDIPLALQVKLLRLLETGTYRRVGGIEPLPADIRLVAATHRDLRRMVEQESFRADLYYRISAFPIHLPALRERRDDIPLLAGSLLTRVSPKRPLRLSEEALRLLADYAFPGNVRELRNILERASVLVDSDVIAAEHLPEDLTQAAEAPGATRKADRYTPTLRDNEEDFLRRMLAAHQGDRKSLAAALGVSERTLYRRLQQLRNGDSEGSRRSG